MTTVHHRENGALVSKGPGVALKALAPLTNGQVYAGVTNGVPVPATITGAGGIVVTPGAGSIAVSTRGSVSSTTIGNVGTGEDDLHSWTMPANTIIVHSGIEVFTRIAFAANGNTKTVKFHVGGSSIVLNPVTTAPNAAALIVALQLWWLSDSSALIDGTTHLAQGGVSTLELTVSNLLSTTIDFTQALVVKLTGEGTDTDDVRSRHAMFRAFRNP